MLGLTCLEVYTSFLNLKEGFNNFEVFTETFDEFPFTELKDELDDP